MGAAAPCSVCAVHDQAKSGRPRRVGLDLLEARGDLSSGGNVDGRGLVALGHCRDVLRGFVCGRPIDVFNLAGLRQDSKGRYDLPAMHGKRLRLTSGEMLAISAALDRLGVPADDSARTAITRSLSSAGLDEATLRRMSARR